MRHGEAVDYETFSSHFYRCAFAAWNALDMLHWKLSTKKATCIVFGHLPKTETKRTVVDRKQ